MSFNETVAITITIGAFVFILGASMLFDKALIIAGNLLIIIGFILIMKSRTADLFKIETLRATIIFVSGLVCLILNYILLGFLLEFIGIFLIFKTYIPDFRTIFYK